MNMSRFNMRKCPVCGGAPKLTKYNALFRVFCRACDHYKVESESLLEAVKLWNTPRFKDQNVQR